MPNGGGDNCGHCPFNEVLANPAGRPGWAEADHGYCSIRQTRIEVALWTYCLNQRTRSPEPDGPIFSCGHAEPGRIYPRIPWHGDQAPQLGHADAECVMCGGPCEDSVLRQGIRIEAEDGWKQFCCNGHYVTWWKDLHPGERIDFWDRDWPEPDRIP